MGAPSTNKLSSSTGTFIRFFSIIWEVSRARVIVDFIINE